MTARVGGIVLAAGAARRLGAVKHALVTAPGTSLVAAAVQALRVGGCRGPVVVVLRPGAVLPSDCPGADVLVNPGADTGVGSSLRLALARQARAVPRLAAVVVTLVDTPGVGPEHVRRLLAAAPGHGGGAAVATYDGVRRTPVLLERDAWDAVAAGARGDVGARAWLDAHPHLVQPVECADLGTWTDVDTPADLQALHLTSPGRAGPERAWSDPPGRSEPT